MNVYQLHCLTLVLPDISIAGKTRTERDFSPKDLISFLMEIKRVKINDKWYAAEITKKTSTLLKKLELPIT
ncbi:MAG TPA: hypothetical protein PLE52_07720 [Paludibacteraceae bacterium]|nr:hypothetical protein [Paludibacteraceae bacterium]